MSRGSGPRVSKLHSERRELARVAGLRQRSRHLRGIADPCWHAVERGRPNLRSRLGWSFSACSTRKPSVLGRGHKADHGLSGFGSALPLCYSSPMETKMRLQVRVNAELVLEAGAAEEVWGPKGSERVIRPPETTLFHQVLTYMQEKPDPDVPLPGSRVSREGVATAALVLRWGSYLCVLLDGDKPLWPSAGLDGTSRVSNSEMARINIEASAALAEWIDLYRHDSRLYECLVNRAVSYLPMPRRTATPSKMPRFSSLANARMAAELTGTVTPDKLSAVQTDAARNPSRMFANALINVAWRNGPIEDIHAGAFLGYPVDQRRVTPAEEKELMRSASDRLAFGMSVCLQLMCEQPRRPWPGQVLPYGLAEVFLVTPSGWSLTEATSEVRLRV